jgi:hypothetical protein
MTPTFRREELRDQRHALERLIESQKQFADQIDKANPGDPYAGLMIWDDICLLEDLERTVRAIMTEVRINVRRWGRFCPGVYMVTCDIDVAPELENAFNFEYTCLGHIFAVVDDFGTLVPLSEYQVRQGRIFWELNFIDTEMFHLRYPSESKHRDPWRDA